MGRTYKEFLDEKLKDPAFKKEWDALEPEYQLINAMLKGREEQNLSQRQLAEKAGITQADVSKIESGNANPTLETLKKIAAGLGKNLQISFVPTAKS